MHVDARQLENNSIIEGDICIIGAGAAGISIALEWMLGSQKVILLEGGGFDYDERVQQLFRGKTTGQAYYPLQTTRLHYFGGTTGHWGGLCSVFDPVVFQKRDWVADSGWPISQDDLLPYYKRAHENLDLGECNYDLGYWQQKDHTLVPLPLDKKVFWNKIWRYSPPTRFGAKYKDVIVRAGNIHLYTYAHVVDIHADENAAAIREVTIQNYTGKKQTVRARYFIMACCAIQNARLLLAANRQAPKGLGNDHDLVGRYFMEHAEVNSGELWLNEKTALKLYMVKPPKVKAELAMTAKKQAELRVLNGIVSLLPLTMGRRIPPLIKTWSTGDPRKNLKQIAAAYENAKDNKLSRFIGGKMYRSFKMVTRLEQAPNPLSRITLQKERDELGMPLVNLHWAFTPLEKRSLRKIFEVLGQEVGVSGIGRVKLLECLQDEKDDSMPENTSGGWHHMGTTRMSRDPRKGVVDANCKVHGIENLYVAGSSCFPNGGAVNPTLTLVALSIRLSDHLKKIAG